MRCMRNKRTKKASEADIKVTEKIQCAISGLGWLLVLVRFQSAAGY